MGIRNFLNINVGTGSNSKDGDTLRAAFQKVNQNFQEVDGVVQDYVQNISEISPTPDTNVNVNASGAGNIFLNSSSVNVSDNLNVSQRITTTNLSVTGDLQILGSLSLKEISDTNIDCGKF